VGFQTGRHDHVKDPGVGQLGDPGILLDQLEVLRESPFPLELRFFRPVLGKAIH
jgi:hypothetical protein